MANSWLAVLVLWPAFGGLAIDVLHPAVIVARRIEIEGECSGEEISLSECYVSFVSHVCNYIT